MELRPRFSLHASENQKHSAMREFTDREEPTKAFMDAVDEKIQERYKVLTYYGVGGIGKSRLLRELDRKLELRDPFIVKTILDFKEEKHRTPSEAMIWLREELKKQHHIKFTSFDLAYIIYWKKLNPQVSMKAKDEALPFLEEGSFIGEVIHQLENVPVAQWFPKTLKFISGIAKYKEILQWWMGNGKAILEQLQDLLPHEIEERLPAYWAADLRAHLASKQAGAVIFIDTYEALWEKSRQQGSFYDKDAWVQELVLQLPEVLWVICGREKIQWAKTNPAWDDELYLEQHLIGALSPMDSDKFLQSCGIHSEEIRKVIIEASHGLPYYLDLMVDTYNLLEETHEPQLHEFSRTPQKILDRFLVYLELPEKETLKVLSFTRHWTIELFRHLVTEFHTGFPHTAYTELFRFSFITKENEQQWQMHVMMRTSLQEQVHEQDADLCQQVHAVLFAYYDEKLTKTSGHYKQLYFEEAFYHGKLALTTDDFLSWFLAIGKQLKNSGHFQWLSAHYGKLQMALTTDADEKLQGAIHQLFGETYLLQGNYEQGVSQYEAALDKYKKVQANPDNAKSLARCSIDLAEINIQLSQYDAAYSLLNEGQNYAADFHGNKDEAYYTVVMMQSVRLGKLNVRFARYEEAMENYRHAIQASEQAADKLGGVSSIDALTALAYEKLGELTQLFGDSSAVDCYLKAIEYYERALRSEDIQDSIRITANMGLAHKRLAEQYSAVDEPAKKIQSFVRALAIYDAVLEQSPYFVDALEKKGHAAVDYMNLQIELNLYPEAHLSFHIAVEAFEKAIELSPKQGGSRNRLASAYRERGKLYMKQGHVEEAIASLSESLMLSAEVIEKTPDYIYSHNSIGKTHEQLADVYAVSVQVDLAEEHYNKALANYKQMLERAPGLKEAAERTQILEKKLK
ncbi:hypothetical protein AUC31_02195 [Planococcus rifietoensis]|uniref:Orc1-like AAA ATPase domain-containing protein n=1 Tax=Planococcus rifietoensis TaxID=200991 RepID=A0A0U2YHN3_9BACL|nr:ATP-binding protein [Planococcus rifietoensis]ALS74138.1 hypothetical protein AUC31_02195 [Planococcus rifietoensis]